MVQAESYYEMELGPLLRKLREGLSLRDVYVATGISISYLSEVERGMREPGLKLLTRLAGLYNVDVRDLVRSAGLSDDGVPDPRIDPEAEVGRAFEYVLADPRFKFGTRPSGPMSMDAKRFIVEMYERFSGKRLLD